jgi:hypothetical protein
VNAPASLERIQRLVAELGAAFQLRLSYAPDHPQVQRALAKVLAAFADWWTAAGTAEVSLILVEGHLLVDRQAIPEDAHWARGLLRGFERHGIRGLTLIGGLDEVELGAFFDGCHAASGPASSRHVLVGRAGFAATGAPENAGDEGQGPAPGSSPAPAAFAPEQVEGACAELRAVGSGQATRIERLRAIVAELARSAEASALDGLRVGVAHVDDREFLHGLAVALSTLRLARALGIGGKALEDLVLSGFLHDVGHVEAGPVADPGRKRSLHPVRGAVRLAALDGMPDEVVLVAFDHHLRFDGMPSYPSLAVPRRPVAAARVVAVADAWETLRAQGATQPSEALEILRSRAGTFLDPALVELFGELVASSRSGSPRAAP